MYVCLYGWTDLLAQWSSNNAIYQNPAASGTNEMTLPQALVFSDFPVDFDVLEERDPLNKTKQKKISSPMKANL